MIVKNTLLFGNGLNQLSDNSGPSWNNLLKQLMGYNEFNHDKLTNTMIYERIFLDRAKPKLKNELFVKEEIAETMKNITGNEYYSKIINLNFENYITTNYDYAFDKTIKISSISDSTENIYSVRRKKMYDHINLWFMHGEIDHPKSIQLGLDHYCGLIGKIDNYLKGNYEYEYEKTKIKLNKMKDKLEGISQYDNVSWIELFFNTNIHILGLGLDYSEIDLWWILTKRARLKIDYNIDNRIIFYTSRIDEQKKGLLQSLKVEVKEINDFEYVEDNKRKTNYHAFYDDVINRISNFTN